MPPVPIWKKLLSYVFGFELESAESELSGTVYVNLVKGRLQLNTDRAVYSFEDKYVNFVKAFERVNWDKITRGRALILGLGLGSVVQILEKKGIRFDRITAVERDETVLYLARKYIIDRLTHSMEMVHADAFSYVSQDQGPYDLVISDIFIDDIIPAPFQGADYIQRLSDILSPGGLLLYNTLAFDRTDREDSEKLFRDRFKPVFPEARILDVAHNFIYINDRLLLKDTFQRD